MVRVMKTGIRHLAALERPRQLDVRHRLLRYRSIRNRSIAAALAAAAAAAALRAQAVPPIVYTVRAPAPETHYIEVEARVPTGGRPSVDLMMAVWSPGFYRVENYADRVDQ